MKTITLVMPPDGRGIDQWAGQQGEHRLSKLIVPLPSETAKKIKSCVAIFVLDDERSMMSPLITEGDSGDAYFKNGKVHYVLWRSLTQCRSLRVQLECYSDDTGQTFIDRTPVSERVMFGKSLSTCLCDFPEVSDQPSVLAQLIAFMHTHQNNPDSLAFLFSFSTTDWQQTGPNTYRLTIPLETHNMGPFAYAAATNVENNDGDQENAVFGVRRNPRGDIIITSTTPVVGEIIIQKGAN